MTIDERIERLTERHEALAQSIELLVIENRERWNGLVVGLERIMDTVEKLAHVAELHQRRMDDQDRRLDHLEGAA